MKKIMFNDKYGLTQAVLEGKKTMTRRIIKGNFEDINVFHANGDFHLIADTKDGDSVEVKYAYEIGERVAIAQPYKNIYEELEEKEGNSKANTWWCNLYESIGDPTKHAGWSNKMFVCAEYILHHIRITKLKLERLQDISNEDCLREGIVKTDCVAPYGFPIGNGKWKNYRTPQDAFACLIDKVSGKGTWDSNLWVFAYEFELLD